MAGKGQVDLEMQKFILAEQEKAKFQGLVHNLTDTCWDRCVEKIGSKLDSRTETCLVNCVERFIDASNFVANRFAQIGHNWFFDAWFILLMRESSVWEWDICIRLKNLHKHIKTLIYGQLVDEELGSNWTSGVDKYSSFDPWLLITLTIFGTLHAENSLEKNQIITF